MGDGLQIVSGEDRGMEGKRRSHRKASMRVIWLKDSSE